MLLEALQFNCSLDMQNEIKSGDSPDRLRMTRGCFLIRFGVLWSTFLSDAVSAAKTHILMLRRTEFAEFRIACWCFKRPAK